MEINVAARELVPCRLFINSNIYKLEVRLQGFSFRRHEFSPPTSIPLKMDFLLLSAVFSSAFHLTSQP